MNRLLFIAETALAGAFTGFLIGPDSLDQFFGMSYDNTVVINLAVGAVVGAMLGFLAASAQKQAE